MRGIFALEEVRSDSASDLEIVRQQGKDYDEQCLNAELT
jgi:hypothetical protein